VASSGLRKKTNSNASSSTGHCYTAGAGHPPAG